MGDTKHAALYAALAKAQAELEGAERSSSNPHFRSKYADLGAVFEAFQSVGPKHGLSVIQLVCDSEKQQGIVLETRLCHASGASVSSRFFMPAEKLTPQAFGSALTYARRYALAAIVGICPVDDDANGASGRPAPVRARAQEESTTTDGAALEKSLAEALLESTTVDTLSAAAAKVSKSKPLLSKAALGRLTDIYNERVARLKHAEGAA